MVIQAFKDVSTMVPVIQAVKDVSTMIIQAFMTLEAAPSKEHSASHRTVVERRSRKHTSCFAGTEGLRVGP